MEKTKIVCKLTGNEKCDDCYLYTQWHDSQEKCWDKNKKKVTKAGFKNLFGKDRK